MKSKFFYLLLSAALFGCKSPKPQLSTVNIEPQDIINSPVEIIFNPMGMWGAFEGQIGDVQLFNANGKRLAIGALVRSGPVVFAKTLKFDANESCKGLLVIRHQPEGDLIEEQKIVTLKIPVRFKPSE
tara:strand:+ start:208 stop:591 length:384 start_codon:yes stop_codon:yes gene_type:complete